MPYDVHWHDPEHTIIRIDVHGDISWDQHHAAMDRVFEEMATVARRVDLIYTGTQPMPSGNPMPHIKKSIARLDQNQNLGLVVIVSPQQVSAIVQTLIDITMRLYRMSSSHNGGFVTTLEEAEVIIARDREERARPDESR
jgi:hypothetical protein